ncbi:hypothetical protein Pla108_32800 [Botrimarina colliarenosi]|uniref:Uncharacterized protein n=1 Tax=Botrimarina colliarenosi TaxID=2528001 RepID=A0A5C6A846_9BACT|nr:hypothetical protein [Botrimarina colliarenosi]TWT96192.1 hypothetical protein Pla108_32800 [Botrimarina colliarenosi]
MRTLRATATAACFGLLGWCGGVAPAAAQGLLAQPGFVAGGPGALAGSAHAAMGGPIAGADAFVDAYGDPLVMPAQYASPSQYVTQAQYGSPAQYGCPPGGYGGGGMPGGAGGDPFGGAYMNTEQCGPHYFDFSAEYLHYSRDKSPLTNSTVYSTNGFVNDDNTVVTSPFDEARVALRGGDVNSEDGDGYRLTGRFDVGALSVVEFTYSGMYWDDSAVALQQGSTQLFSVYSLYGSATNGDFDQDGTAGPPSGADFAETANADRHMLEYESELHTAEASYRRYWVGFNPRVSGTLLIGFRYTNLNESLTFSSFATPGSISIGSEADNDLAGVQVGGDMWITLLQGLRVGGESKVGLYNNSYKAKSVVASATGPSFNSELFSGDQTAFMAEAKLMAVADLTPSWSLKAGYEFLFISDLATVGDSTALAQPYGDINNISQFQQTALPAGVGPAAGANSNGEAFFHGFTAGVEYVW